MEIEQARLLTLKAAHMMDTVGNKARAGGDRDDQGDCAEHDAARDRSRHPGAWRRRRVPGFRLADAWARSRIMRIVDGPDEVHNRAVARIELRK